MSEKTLRRIVAILGALVAMYGIVWLTAGRGRASGSANNDNPLAGELERIRADSLTGLTVTSPAGERIALSRDDSVWRVNGFRADSQAIDRLKRAIADADVAALASRSATNHARLGVASDSTWTVALRNDADSVRLLIGNDGPTYPGAYIRLPDADQVFEVTGDLRNALTLSPGDWRDRAIARVDTAAIQTVVIERDARTARLERREDGWHVSVAGVPEAAAPDSATVASVLSELARFDATGFAADSAFTGEDRRSVVALAASGDTLAAVRFAGLNSNWHAQARGHDAVFQVAGYRVDRIAPTIEEIVPSPDGS
ncbi:MAG: DUF4340 domain-containing protein [Longimicrobiales bacterium]